MAGRRMRPTSRVPAAWYVVGAMMATLLHSVLLAQPAECIATADDANCVEHTLRPLKVRACVGGRLTWYLLSLHAAVAVMTCHAVVLTRSGDVLAVIMHTKCS